jgi:hypothetical protein
MGVPLTHSRRAAFLLQFICWTIAKQSSEAATAIAEAVQKKLGSKNPVVKFKARTDVQQQQHGLYGSFTGGVY